MLRFKAVRRIVTPIHLSWNEAGKILAEIGSRQPEYWSKIQALFNDVLIAACALQIGAIVYTRNEKDFQLIRRYKGFDLEILPE